MALTKCFALCVPCWPRVSTSVPSSVPPCPMPRPRQQHACDAIAVYCLSWCYLFMPRLARSFVTCTLNGSGRGTGQRHGLRDRHWRSTVNESSDLSLSSSSSWLSPGRWGRNGHYLHFLASSQTSLF